MDLSDICKIIGHFHVSKQRTVRTQMATDEHGSKKKVCFAFGEKGHLTSRQPHMSIHGSAARRFLLICGYLCKSVFTKSLSNNRNIIK